MWYYEANCMALGELGFGLPFEKYMYMMAHGTTVWEEPLRQGISQSIIDKAREKRNTYYQQFIQTKDLIIDGVEDTLKELSYKYKMAIVTTSRRVDFELIHSRTNLLKYMDFVLCEEDYPRAKPYPDPYLKAIEIFGCKKNEALVIEDSQRGLSAAVSANIECVTVKNEFTQTHDFSKSTYKIDSIKELTKLLEEMN
ncbi:HAD family hydrolase [Arcobacter sp. FWKO B]|nr:HAD family hydrolase [Arcobacter sp. FWKO B]